MSTQTLDSKLVERIAFHVLAGDHRKVAARKEGVRGADYGRWEKRGSDLLDEGESPSTAEDELYVNLVNAVELAEAQCEARWRKEWVEAAEKGRATGRSSLWQPYATLLERRFPQRWSRTEKPKDEKQTPDDFFREAARAEEKAKK